MDFLNQFPNPNAAKDDASIFSFTEKEQKGDLPFDFGTQSSEAGEMSFLNQMKSQDQGESFALDDTQKNMGGLNFLKTIYEVPESSNNIFNSEGEGFPLQNPISAQMGLDFIRESNEDNFNFDSFHNKQNSCDGEVINVDINNLFKNTQSRSGDNSKQNNSNDFKNNIKGDNGKKLYQDNNNMNMNKINVNIQSSGKKVDNSNTNMNINMNDNVNINMNKIPSFPNNMDNQNKNINITPESRSNPVVNQRQNMPNNTSVVILNKNKFNGDNLNNGIPDTNNIMPPQFQNIQIKPQMPKEQKNNLEDIDKMISMSLQTKPENKQNNKNINNNLPNDISDIFSSTTMLGKRASIEQKDKDLQNIDNLLNFTKEPMPSYTSITKNSMPTAINNPTVNNNNNNNINSQVMKKQNQGSNTIMIKPLPGDSFDKKSQVIKLTKADMVNISQKETSNKVIDKKNKNNIPSKLEMTKKYNDLAMRLNKIREQAKEYRNLGNYFSQLISANENYEFVYPNVIRKLLEDYYRMSNVLLRFMKIRNDRMTEMNNEFDEEVRKYSLTFPESI